MITAADFLKWCEVFGVIFSTPNPPITIPLPMAQGGTGADITPVANSIVVSGASVMGLIAPVNNAVMVYSSGGVPSASTTLPSGLTIPGYLPTAGGTMSGAIAMGSHAITGLSDPSGAQDAMTLHYAGLHYLALAGGTMAGGIAMGGFGISGLLNPVNPQDAVTLSYLETFTGAYLPLAGGTMSGAINMGGFGINNLLDPVSLQDAATKNYVNNIAGGLNPIDGVYGASTANLTGWTYTNLGGVGDTLTAPANGVFTEDGVSPPVNSRWLYKNDTDNSGIANGIWSITTSTGGSPAVLTRATDYNTASQIKVGDLISVEFGTANGTSSWYQTATVVTVGTSPIAFSVWFNPQSYVANSLAQGTIFIGNSGGAAVPTTATYPGTATINTIMFASSTNAWTGLATAVSSVMTTNGSGVPGWSSELSLALGGTNANLTAALGAIPYSTASAFAFLAPAGSAGLAFLSGGAGAPTWSTNKPITKINTILLTSTQTYTPSAGLVYADVTLGGDGGGSGGAAGAAGQLGASGGGSSGGVCRSLFTAANIGASAALVIGAGGAAGTAGNHAGGNGTGSTFTCSGTGATMTAAGGVGGSGSVSTASVTVATGGGNPGGTSGGNVYNSAPGNGSVGTVISGVNGIGLAGIGGGIAPFSVPNINYAGTSVLANQNCQGGSGVLSYDNTNQIGQVGANGACLITEYISL